MGSRRGVQYQFALPASVGDLLNWVRQDAAVVNSASTGMVVVSCCTKVTCAPFFVASRTITHVQVVGSFPLSVTGLVYAAVESLQALSFEEHDGHPFFFGYVLGFR